MIDTFHSVAQRANEAKELGQLHLVLVEGRARRSPQDSAPLWSGRTDSNKKCLFPSDHPLPCSPAASGESAGLSARHIQAGDFVLVRVTGVRSHTLRADPLSISTISEYGSSMK